MSFHPLDLVLRTLLILSTNVCVYVVGIVLAVVIGVMLGIAMGMMLLAVLYCIRQR